MTEMREQDEQRKAAGRRLEEEQMKADDKKEREYQEWDSCVYKRIQNQLARSLNPEERQQKADTLNFGGSTRMQLMRKDDPLKRTLFEKEQENTVSRKANSLLFEQKKQSEQEGPWSARAGADAELSLSELEQM